MATPTLQDPSAWLGHYTSADTALRYILPTQQIRMNLWANMNDPFEFKKLTFIGGGAIGDVPDMDERLAAADRAAEQIRARARLACFTQVADTDSRYGSAGWFLSAPYARPRMWAQYGDDHRGVCLVFDREALQRAANHPAITFSAVEYTDGGFRDTEGASAPDLASFTVEEAPEAVFEHSLRLFNDFLFVKTRDWEAEHEYRFVLDPDAVGYEPLKPDEFAYLPIADALRYVMIGERFPDEQLPELLTTLGEWPDVEIRRMIWDLGIAAPVTVKSMVPRSPSPKH